jgi:hypothetical protein
MKRGIPFGYPNQTPKEVCMHVIESTTDKAEETTAEVMEVIEQIARDGARKIIRTALEEEVQQHLARYKDYKVEQVQRMVVRNGHAHERTIRWNR